METSERVKRMKKTRVIMAPLDGWAFLFNGKILSNRVFGSKEELLADSLSASVKYLGGKPVRVKVSYHQRINT